MRETVISEGTKISIGFVGILTMTVVSIAVSISVSRAQMEAVLAGQAKSLDQGMNARDRMQEKINSIDARTARIEGMLEEMKGRK